MEPELVPDGSKLGKPAADNEITVSKGQPPIRIHPSRSVNQNARSPQASARPAGATHTKPTKSVSHTTTKQERKRAAPGSEHGAEPVPKRHKLSAETGFKSSSTVPSTQQDDMLRIINVGGQSDSKTVKELAAAPERDEPNENVPNAPSRPTTTPRSASEDRDFTSTQQPSQPSVHLTAAEVEENVKAQIDRLERVPITTRYDLLKKLISLTSRLQTVGRERYREDAQTEKLVWGKWLEEDQVITAISALTEAVQCSSNLRNEDNPLRPNHFGLLSCTTFHTAKLRPIPDGLVEAAQVIRPRAKLMFPWIFNSEEYANDGQFRTSSAELQEAAKNTAGHIILVTVDSSAGGPTIPCIMIYDSLKTHLKSCPDLFRLVKREIRKTVSNFGICDFPTIGAISPPSSDEALFEIVEARAAQQTNFWTCGIHAILNAWSFALLFRIDPQCELDRSAYKMAIQIINLAVDGRASINMIARFLIETGFVIYPGNRPFRRLTPSRINHYHDLRSWADLDGKISTERAIHHVDMAKLRETHAQDTSISDFKENAAEESDGSEPPISPRTLDFFLAHPEVKSRPLAQEQCHSIFESFQNNNLIKSNDSEELTQRSKDTFIKRFLAIYVCDDKDYNEDDSWSLLSFFESSIMSHD